LSGEDKHLQIFRADGVEPYYFGEVDARWLVGADTAGATAIAFGQATYPPGTAIERHYHPNAEEVVIVLAGRARHIVGDDVFELGPGDTCFIPRGAPHSLECASDEQLVILWAWGGAASVEAAGFIPVD
jgi:quercetin dioxygenase-like cupin family protein